MIPQVLGDSKCSDHQNGPVHNIQGVYLPVKKNIGMVKAKTEKLWEREESRTLLQSYRNPAAATSMLWNSLL